MTLPQVRDILDVVWIPGKVVDPRGKMLTGLQMAGDVVQNI